jgi:tetratricopeptide (TPR) repeat protein
MKKYLLSMSLAALMATSALAPSAMAQRVPAPSPAASVMQTVGVTDFTVKYSRPFIKGRKVFADGSALAPYDQIWRTGANMATVFEASTEFTFGGKKVPAGKYALFSIPNGAAWTVILNKDYNQGGSDNYKESEDVARTMVVPTSNEYNEAFKVEIEPVTDSTAFLNLSWSSVNIPVPLAVSTESLTLTALNKAVAEKPEDVATLQSTAGYLLSKGKDLQVALSLADKAIGLKESFGALWTKAQILNKLGKTTEAIPVAQKALAVGAAAPDGAYNFYKPQVEKAIAEMQAKAAPVKEAVSTIKKKKK